ncbi:MAG: nicotinate-nucleotide pyrophosphorylase [Pseudomonadota bacterium]|jgi:nicotinate-nucleotide pyrophosphorylase (carboxylating)
MTVTPLYPLMYEDLVRAALREDLGRAGDLSAAACVPAEARARAVLRARAPGVIAGLDPALLAFRLLDPGAAITVVAADGTAVPAGGTVAVVGGLARPILSAERTALNLLGRLSGIATQTAALVAAVAGTRALIADTRKTTPGLRLLEKYAVRAGGGSNHRFGLDDAVMIKDNHIVAAGGITAAVARARAHVGHMVKIEVEVDTLEQLEELLRAPADVVLLDNMDPPTLARAVALVAGRMVTEASGGVTPQTVRAVAETGVDLISLGWLTHSVRNFDIGLDFEPV